MTNRFISICCGGERCGICGKPAEAKVEEVIFHDDPRPVRHPYTAYICGVHFDQIMHTSPKSEGTEPADQKPEPEYAPTTPQAPDSRGVEQLERLKHEIIRLREEAILDDRAAAASQNADASPMFTAWAEMKRVRADDIEWLITLSSAARKDG